VNVPDEGAVRPRPQSLPVFGSGGNASATAVPSSASRRGGTTKNTQAPPRRSPSSISNSSGWGGGGEIQPIVNGGPFPRQWTGWPNRSKPVGGEVIVIR
jgi:hypothetical protein